MQQESMTIQGGARRSIRIPALFACIEHPSLGPILFDTGYSERFFTATQRFPYSLYRKVTPVTITAEDTAVHQLKKAGIDSKDVKYIILSHFHADHIGGVSDFPNAAFMYVQAAYDKLKHRQGLSAVRAGFLPDLLPKDFTKRSQLIDETKLRSLPASFPFDRGLDVFGDGSVIAVDVPGHAVGQIGVLVQTEQQPYFLCADAVWSSEAFRKSLPPHWLAGLIMDDRRQYQESFQRVVAFHRQHPEFRIIPSHCHEIEQSLQEGGGRP